MGFSSHWRPYENLSSTDKSSSDTCNQVNLAIHLVSNRLVNSTYLHLFPVLLRLLRPQHQPR